MSFIQFDSVPHNPLKFDRGLWGTLSKNKRATSNHLVTCGSFEKGGECDVCFCLRLHKRERLRRYSINLASIGQSIIGDELLNGGHSRQQKRGISDAMDSLDILEFAPDCSWLGS